ncbi:LacI family transcriptional regulator [Rathayibacter sp. PhB93]|uniref:LacI family DNA-binding transcriptional regulator n=1 Tax=unclassified Rathayibacter TaxID=2609250 RepID=UPI000F9F5BC3|nr:MULTISPECIES: LacI family DNA-binding transcriptional regulator [unclassified Rathayibacter]ROQ04634.1 LacI family transcriptional regulator [Rathayibacter sp. PhB93]TDQ13472.1 LacI family transcriptional regulator [Rathayibacter sp. PhB1]
MTSAEVAARAGVSRSAVSQILNGEISRFPAATQARVRDAAAALGYRPSRAARALVTGVSDVVVLLLPHVTFGPHLQDMVDGITAASRTAGLTVVVRYADDEPEATLLALHDLLPAAVIDLGVLEKDQRHRLHEAGIRVVPRRRSDPLSGEVDQVDVDIGRMQVRHLTRNGPRRLVYAALADKRLDPFGPRRLQGIRQECAALGIDEPVEVRVPLELDGASAEIRSVLADADDRPSGFCCYNDDVAIAVVAAARALGISLPDRLSAIGVDGSALGQLISPRLTTIRVKQSVFTDAITAELLETVGAVASTEPASPIPLTLVPGETS